MQGATRCDPITTVPPEGIDLMPPAHDLVMMGFEVQSAGVLEFVMLDQPDDTITINTLGQVYRPLALRMLGAGTTALPILVFYGKKSP